MYQDVDAALDGTLITLFGDGGVELAHLHGERADILWDKLGDLIAERNRRYPECGKCRGTGWYDHDLGRGLPAWSDERYERRPCDQCAERGVTYPQPPTSQE